MFDLTPSDAETRDNPSDKAHWSGVWAMTLCVGTLIASEFMPVSLLSPLARDLHLTEGAAGQAIAISGLFAVITSLSISTLTRGVDRKSVLLALTLLMAVAGLLVTLAPNYTVLMAGRACLGIVIGGFWSMSAATVMRLVPQKDVPKALSLLNGGNALATTIAAPLGSFLGQYVGWRGAFFLVVPCAAVTIIWQGLRLPRLPEQNAKKSKSAIGILSLPQAKNGMIAVAFLFMGQFTLFTYVRPFLETVTRASVPALSTILLLMGLAGLAGNALFASRLTGKVRSTLVVAPTAMAVLALGLVCFGMAPLWAALMLIIWGLISTILPVAWWSWLSQAFPKDAEPAGGLMVAVIQLAITLGASVGGVIYDHLGYGWTFTVAAAFLLLSPVVFLLRVQRAPVRA
ncbi:MFS transporter [Asticcacaulis excentricus]|uniref:Major facilitator superfamily MFS_1 n=1 Tax=Asticcacaulis excentricus (strain ATCC 15261 / DSM 4724 / KCTC 12464 / NCIMB 9791 / VKM B-1370 / CB 48) TaxID=573065 RepID=E8RLI2_ASTEC|nr:MFS transporter [Asticcacaulis excentricus]ADU13726.1 major facilitator superfamily MFS_1 [Asticcacaulis excentricus CB 48]